MSNCLFGDVVKEVKEKVDRENNPYEFFVAGDHMDSDELHLLRRGRFADSDVGPAFIRVFRPGQVLYGSRRTYLRKVAVADFEGITANTTFVLETKDESVLLQRLLPFIMQSERFVQHSIKRSKGSTNPYVLFSDLADYEFSLPDIGKQERLADLLWAIDSLRTKYKQLIAATDELVKSQFMELFGDPRENPKGYPVRPLSEIADYWNGLTYHPSDVADSGTIVLRSSNIQNGSLAFGDLVRVQCQIPDRALVRENDILMCSRNGSAELVGKVSLIPAHKEPMAFGAFMMIVRSDYYDYLLQYFRHPAFREQIDTGTATINQITRKMLDQIVLPVPSKEEIKDFAHLVFQSDKSKFELEQALTELTATYKRIISEQLG